MVYLLLVTHLLKTLLIPVVLLAEILLDALFNSFKPQVFFGWFHGLENILKKKPNPKKIQC